MVGSSDRTDAQRVRQFVYKTLPRIWRISVNFVFHDPDVSFLPQSPRVVGVICDEKYWKSIGKLRPNEVENHQLANLNYAISFIETEWVLHVDVDELVISSREIGDILGWQPEDCFRSRAANRGSLRIEPKYCHRLRDPLDQETPKCLNLNRNSCIIHRYVA